MAFTLETFNNVSSGAAGALKVWSYKNTGDTLATIIAPGYFDPVRFRLHEDDIIFSVGSDGSDQLVVTSTVGNTVTVVVYVPSSGGAPSDATYITQVANPELPNEQAMGALATGIVKNTTTTGVQSIAVAGTDYTNASSTDTFTNKTFDANGTGNSLSNVDVADLANGTDGELITWDAAGAPAVVTTGSAGEVLTSNGAGAAPTFQVGGAPSAATYITQTASGDLSAEQALGDLATGILKSTTTTGVVSIAVAGTDYTDASSTDTFTNKTFDANGTGNSLSNVDVADLANGTDGELITWDASGVATTVGAGTSAQVLTSNGAGAAPTFQTPAGGGLGTLISTATASNAVSIDMDNVFTTAYDYYKLVVMNLNPEINNALIWIRIGTGATPTYQSGASDYSWAQKGVYGTGTAADIGDALDSQIDLTNPNAAGVVTDQARSLNAVIDIYDPSSTANGTWMTYSTAYNSSLGTVTTSGTGAYLATTAVTSIQLVNSLGNDLDYGDLYLYGFNKS